SPSHAPPAGGEPTSPEASCVPRISRFFLSPVCSINTVEHPDPCPHRLLHVASVSGGEAMTFEEMLDQAITMLQRRGRGTYRTLRLQFQLDEEQLEALKEALIDAERLAVDEAGRVLVWTGAPASLPLSSPSQGATQDPSSEQASRMQEIPATAMGHGAQPSD